MSVPGLCEPDLGDYLGDLTNEIDGDDYIVEGVFPVSKNYAFITKNKKKLWAKLKEFHSITKLIKW